MILPRKKLLFGIIAVAFACGWVYWNRPTRVDMASYVPADCLAFVEANDLTQIAAGIENTEAWKSLAAPIGAPASLLPNRWLIGVARWTGIGSTDAVLAARSQVAVVFSNATATETDTTLTIKPLAAVIIETHTFQRRMRPAIQRHVDDFARHAYGQTTFAQKQTEGIDLYEWSASDNSRRLVLAIVGTTAIVGNDESFVVRCADVRLGKQPALAGDGQLEKLRQELSASTAALVGFIPKRGVKPILQAWALNQSSKADAAAQILSNTIGNLIDGFAWSSRFESGGTEDRCLVSLSQGVVEGLRSNFVPEKPGQILDFVFVPPDANSVSTYTVRDLEGAWRDLNVVVSSHTDALGALAARPLLRSIFKSYGIDDAETFVRSVGPRFQTIRMQDRAAVLVADAFDPPTLRKIVEKCLGPNPKTETVGDAQLLLSATDNWSASFAGNRFLIGPADSVRRCLQTKAQSQSLSSASPFQRAQAAVDFSLPISALTFTSDRESAISFVELFSHHDRSAFSTNAASIQQATNALPYGVSVTILKADGFEWTSRSSFGLLGSLFTTFAPEKSP